MTLTPEIIKIAQRYLNLKNLNAGAVDGVPGNKTHAALNNLQGLTKSWPPERKLWVQCSFSQKRRALIPGL